MNDHYEFADKLFDAIVETLKMAAPALLTRATPDPKPEQEKKGERKHRSTRLGGKRIA